MSEINSMTFLNNYMKFGCAVRYETAKTLHEATIKSKNKRQIKALYLGVIEEFASQSEDFCFLVAAHRAKNEQGPWEFILSYDVSYPETKKLLNQLASLNSAEKIRSFLKISSINNLTKMAGGHRKKVIKSFFEIKNTADVILSNRTKNDELLVRVHNKIKHGMAVLDEGPGTLFIRDYREKSKMNRNYGLTVDMSFSETLIQHMQIAHEAMQALINLYRLTILIDIERKPRKTALDKKIISDFKSGRAF